MYWFSRPPIGRYAAAVLALVAGLLIEFRPSTTVDHPFAVNAVAAGETLEPEGFEWRPVPAGLLEPVEITGTARVAIPAGAPLLSALIDGGPAGVPDGWWGLDLALPAAAGPGTQVRIVLHPPGAEDQPYLVPGVVVAAADGDSAFSLDGPRGIVAIPETEAAAVAAAVADRRATVLIAP